MQSSRTVCNECRFFFSCNWINRFVSRICRNRLEGNTFEGKPIVFPPLEESIKHRYRLFYSMYRKLTREQLDAVYEELKESLEESKVYAEEESVDLTLA